ncbi:winged helix-turn-helix transcriptional regulator [Nonomuraea turkmeniaca]|uniref:Winged helix-turn-helix transcriptional regulator n=1 Tax=Nonomuraea turkmeniaca TaxID=103838 RepID=A0A5S4F1C1_9ACTN|nr:winged helix-turn-helix domain-containing protein [Nonomuraea turkmeniaca]TMR09874.1 winged helix-turn-helix transcriptional regulator [Nonomuraea turkmeniaca]
MLRIHFTSDDLVRTRIVPAADPLWEIALSICRLAGRRGQAMFAEWRHQARDGLAKSDALDIVRRVLGPLYRGTSLFIPDFLTPPDSSLGLDAGVDAVLSTPRLLLRQELDKLAGLARTPTWAWGLADGRKDAFHDLRDGLYTYFDTALRPHWSNIQGMVDADRAMRGRAYLEGGVEAMLSSFRPAMSWESPVLTVAGHPVDRDVHLGGRGLVLIPSYFCWGAPVPLADPDLPQVLVYPIQRDRMLGVHKEHSEQQPGTPIGRLLGPTRAAILRATVNGATTSELARRHEISAPAVSQHTQVLREAGLIVSQRAGPSVIHTLTPLGRALLMGATMARGPFAGERRGDG